MKAHLLVAFALLFALQSLAFVPSPTKTWPVHQQRSKCKSSLPTIGRHAQLIQNNDKAVDRPPKFGWDKDSPKPSLEFASIQTSHTATPWFLNVVEVAHWMLAVPCFMGSFAVMKYHDVWFQVFDEDSLRLLLWCLAPLLQYVSSLPFMVVHSYDDWQIAPVGADETIYSNGRLREVAYSFLFTLQGLASLAFVHAYLGWSTTATQTGLGVSAVLLFHACWGDKNHKLSQYLAPFFDNNESVLPVPVSTAFFMLYSQILAILFVYTPLASQVVDNNNGVLKLAIFFSPIAGAMGGMIEGIGAETTFDQRYHFMAALTMMAGVSAQAWSLFQLGQVLG